MLAPAPPPSPAERRPDRLEYIDVLRGLAALYVVLHHVYLATFGSGAMSGAAWLLSPLMYGRAGVDLFLVVSGFVLYRPLAAGWRTPEAYGRFMARRAWRIVPPYYAAIGLALLLLAWVPGLAGLMMYTTNATPMTLIWHLLMLNNLGTPTDMFAFNYPLWTIPLEFQLYAVFPLIVPLFKRLGGLPVALLATFVTLASRVVAAYGSHHGLAPVLVALLTTSFPAYLSVFVAGMAAAEAVLARESKDHKTAWFTVGALAAAIAGTKAWDGPWSFLVCDPVWGLGFGLLVVAASGWRWTPPSWLVEQGRRSYSLYLTHAPLLGCLQLLVIATPILLPVRDWLLFALGIPLFVIVAWGFHIVFERPFLGRPPWQRG